jgi:transposase-like protein
MLVKQDHRAMKRATTPTLNFKSFRSARNVLARIEFKHNREVTEYVKNGFCKQPGRIGTASWN